MSDIEQTQTMLSNLLSLAKSVLEISYPLATGPNKLTSEFAKILEGVFRKDYFTLQTMVALADAAERDSNPIELRKVFGGSILDLSRRVLEDAAHMDFIGRDSTKTKEYVQQFLYFADIERKEELNLLKKHNISTDDIDCNAIEVNYQRVPEQVKEDYKKRRPGKLIKEFIPQDTRVRDVFWHFYIVGNRKNHTSASDILFGHLFQQDLTQGYRTGIAMGLLITLWSMLQVAILFTEETGADENLKKNLQEYFDSLGDVLEE